MRNVVIFFLIDREEKQPDITESKVLTGCGHTNFAAPRNIINMNAQSMKTIVFDYYIIMVVCI